jgi:hypothetical protein
MVRWAGNVALMGERSMHLKFWWISHKGKKSRGKSRRRWEVNIKIDLREIG